MRTFLSVCAFFVLCCVGGRAQGQQAEIKGFLYDKSTGEAIIYTNVYLRGTKYGTATDVNGYYALAKIEPGTYTLLATSVGYDTIREEITLAAGQILNKKLYISERSKELQTVEIQSSRSQIRRATTVNASITQITPKDIKLTPSVGGETDLAQYIQTVPGVVSTGDQGGNVYIRGGTLTQNLTLLDGMVIYNPFHSIGLYSIFDGDLLKSADFATAGFGPQYGGRASSVIDAKTIDGNKNRPEAKFSINTIATKASVTGPLVKGANGGGLTYVASVRHSYLDKIGPTLYPYASKDGYKLGFGFTDVFGKLTLFSGNGNKVSLSGFNFNDRADIGAPNQFTWNNYGLGLNFILLPGNSRLLINGTFAYSSYGIDISQTSSPKRSSGVDGFNGGLDFTYSIGYSELKYGLGIIGNNTYFKSPSETGQLFDQTAYNTEFFGYFKYRINAGKLIIDPGLRYHYYASINTSRIEPRIGAKLFVFDRIKIKAAGGLYSQNLISTKSDRDVVNLFNGFISSPDEVKKVTGVDATGQATYEKIDKTIQTAEHAVAGIELDLMDGLEVDLEGYVKNFSQFVNINIARRKAEDPIYVAESGLARGVDLTVIGERPKGSVKVTYSLAKVTRKYGPTTYSPNYDRRHNLNILVAFYPIRSSKAWEVDARFNFGTGLPFTQTQGFYENVDFNQGINTDPNSANGSLGIYYGGLSDYNKGRLPTYHRLDISLKRTLSVGPRGSFEASIGATNIYNRKNIFYVDRLNLSSKVYQLPFLPYLALSASF